MKDRIQIMCADEYISIATHNKTKFRQDCLDREDEAQDAMPVHPVEIAIVICILVMAVFVGWLLW